MSEYVSFTYKSIGNFCHLLLNIQYEKTHTPREITVFHQRFDNDETDNLIEEILVKLFPNGANIGEKELIQLTSYIENFMLKDKKTQDLFVEYDKKHYSYYVYFKPDNIVYECGFAEHAKIVKEICLNFFKDFDDIDPLYIKKFIIENFEISSDNSTVESISNDYNYIARAILIKNRRFQESTGLSMVRGMIAKVDENIRSDTE